MSVLVMLGTIPFAIMGFMIVANIIGFGIGVVSETVKIGESLKADFDKKAAKLNKTE